MGRIQELVLGIAAEHTTFARRGFRSSDPALRHRLESIGRTFISGYNLALRDDDDLEALARRLNLHQRDQIGFAFEGASMALALLDKLAPSKKRRRLLRFLVGPGTNHIYMVHVGVGWAIARLPWLRPRVEHCLKELDPLLGWLAVDGFGFHEGYFHWQRYVLKQEIPRGLSAWGRRTFDQGLGRSLWFVDGADVSRIPLTIAKFAPGRQSDLWSGVGLACAYAGGATSAAIEVLKRSALPYQPQLAQGAAFAAKAQKRAGNQADHTDRACQILCGVSLAAAADVTDEALKDLSTDGSAPLYELWRRRIQTRFTLERSS